ncbi:MAG: 1-acyl-sn-glycerol-3-phosphate acyltransferase [Bacteroidetes bacterium]|nr:1-acyl-sn-glycerol-3-phosphate acyltransferase [Bacteroidota bacterium]
MNGKLKELNIFPDGPIVFAPNHQNAFLDAVLVACSSKRNPFFLARADVFKNPRAAKWLNPAIRCCLFPFPDGFRDVENNDATSKCHKLFDKWRSGTDFSRKVITVDRIS